MPEIKCGVTLLPSVRITQAPRHVHRIDQADFLALKQLAGHRPVKTVDDPPGNMLWNWRPGSMHRRPHRCGKFQQMNFAQDKIMAVKPGSHASGGGMVDIVLV